MSGYSRPIKRAIFVSMLVLSLSLFYSRCDAEADLFGVTLGIEGEESAEDFIAEVGWPKQAALMGFGCLVGLVEGAFGEVVPAISVAETFNGSSSDLPVLRYRAMVHKLPAAGLSARPYFHRYTDDATDLCDVLSSFAPGAKASLHELCRVMGLPGKPDAINGLGERFPKHIYHSIICIGALVAHRQNAPLGFRRRSCHQGHWQQRTREDPGRFRCPIRGRVA
jgi:predicted 3'-5' exonuclease similar to PolB exonuclease domain